MRTITYSIFLLVLISCSSYYGISNRALKHYYLSLETTPCFGRCPILKVDITGERNAYLQARRFVDSVGQFRMELEPSKMKELIYSSKKVSWTELKSEYLTNYSDLPSRIVRYSIKPGDTTTVKFEQGAAPKELEDLGSLIYELTDTVYPWKRIAGTMNQ